MRSATPSVAAARVVAGGAARTTIEMAAARSADLHANLCITRPQLPRSNVRRASRKRQHFGRIVVDSPSAARNRDLFRLDRGGRRAGIDGACEPSDNSPDVTEVATDEEGDL